jgi:hypothetical protein
MILDLGSIHELLALADEIAMAERMDVRRALHTAVRLWPRLVHDPDAAAGCPSAALPPPRLNDCRSVQEVLALADEIAHSEHLARRSALRQALHLWSLLEHDPAVAAGRPTEPRLR